MNNTETIVVTREYLISLLKAWQENQITAADVHSTATHLYWPGSIEVLDWEGDDESASIIALQYLDMLDMNFITQEDIEPTIEFLQTPIGHLDIGYKKWALYKHSINLEERIKKLNGQFPYIYDERYPKA